MEIKSKISIVLGEIKNFNFLKVLLTRKQKKMFNEIIMNEELINHYESQIKNAEKEIVVLKMKIKNIEQNNGSLRVKTFNIGKIFG